MTSDQNKPEQAATKSWKVPSLIRALMVMCVLVVVGGTGWYSWQWWQRERERQLFLDLHASDLKTSGEALHSIITRYGLSIHLGGIDVRSQQIDPRYDLEWYCQLTRGKYDWYVSIQVTRPVYYAGQLFNPAAGCLFFKLPPKPSGYQPPDSVNEQPDSTVTDISSADWHYVMDFVYTLKTTRTVNGTDASLIHCSLNPKYKPDPRFDCGELVE